MNRVLHLWMERLVRASVDFFAVQVAGLLSLYLVLVQNPNSQPSEAAVAQYYLHTFVPLSLVFPGVHMLFGLYSKLRGYTLGYKLRRAALSASIATLLLVFLTFLMSRSQLPRSAALLFGCLAVGAAVSVRWLKDYLFHRESQLLSSRAITISQAANTDAILVVGGAGYIGSMVIAKLLKEDRRVRLLDNLTYGNHSVEQLLEHPKFEFIQGDCRNIQDVVRAMSKVKAVIHLAAIVGDPACAQDDKNAFQINYAATRMMLEVARGHNVERFIFASSCSVYGSSEGLMDEQSETDPISLYAETKLQSEKVLLEAASTSFHPTILRFATVFGLARRPRFDLIVNLLTAKAIQDGCITIFNGDQWRPFIHVDDVAEGVLRILGAPVEAVSAEILNLGDDRFNMTLSELAEKIRAFIPNTRVEYVENDDRRNYRVSFRKIRDCVGFTAAHSVEDGILEIKQAFERGQISNYRNPFYSNVSFLKERGHVNPKNETDRKVMAAFAGGGSQTLQSLRPASAARPFTPTAPDEDFSLGATPQ